MCLTGAYQAVEEQPADRGHYGGGGSLLQDVQLVRAALPTLDGADQDLVAQVVRFPVDNGPDPQAARMRRAHLAGK